MHITIVEVNKKVNGFQKLLQNLQPCDGISQPYILSTVLSMLQMYLFKKH